jgi:hypothetical protein
MAAMTISSRSGPNPPGLTAEARSSEPQFPHENQAAVSSLQTTKSPEKYFFTVDPSNSLKRKKPSQKQNPSKPPAHPISTRPQPFPGLLRPRRLYPCFVPARATTERLN